MSDEIIWWNHAGYELRANGLRMVHDPWLCARAFDDGWALLADSAHGPADFAGVDYLWLSHEHPDHFEPGLLRAIEPAVRRTITVLFQRTRDRRVVQFCRELGFKVCELLHGERIALGEGVFVTCGVAGDDSWLFTETPERTYFNTNDVVGCDWRAVVRDFARPVDVLLAQFSYASGRVGAPGEHERMRAAAMQQIAFIDEQIAAASPRWLIPFASYMWFCRPENFHLNAGANRIDAIERHFRERVPTVVLYPGDRWTVGAPWDNESALHRYAADRARHAAPLAAPPPVSWSELQRLAAERHQRLRSENLFWALRPLRVIGFVRPVSIWLTDLGVGATYDSFGMGLCAGPPAQDACEIALHSSSLALLLRHGFGMGTLMVNGCFRELQPGALTRLSRHFALAAHNQRGDRFPGALLRPRYLVRFGPLIAAALVRQLRAVAGRPTFAR